VPFDYVSFSTGTFTNDELVPGSFIFVPGFRDTKYQSKTKRGQMARFLKKYLSKNNKLCILLILEIQALKWCNIYLTDIWFKSYTWSKQIFWYKLSSFPPLKNTVLPRFRVSNVNIFFKTLYQIKAFNIFFLIIFGVPPHKYKYLKWPPLIKSVILFNGSNASTSVTY
jgi:hypothetical protein